MIEGMKVEFTSAELIEHLRGRAEWWRTQVARMETVIEKRRHGTDPRAVEQARHMLDNARHWCRRWTLILPHVPAHDRFLFTLEQAREIEFPPGEDLTDEELEGRMFARETASGPTILDFLIPKAQSSGGEAGKN